MKSAIVLAAAVFSLASAAGAQSADPGTGPAPTPSTVPDGYATRLARDLFRQAEFRTEYSQRLRYTVDQPPRRLDRAERLASLVNAGQCETALEIARSEGDLAMVNRLRTVCRL